MEIGVVVAIVVSLVTAAISVGASLSKIGAMGERIKGLEKGAERQGERIGQLEQHSAAQRAVNRERRASVIVEPAAPRYIRPEESDEDDSR